MRIWVNLMKVAKISVATGTYIPKPELMRANWEIMVLSPTVFQAIRVDFFWMISYRVYLSFDFFCALFARPCNISTSFWPSPLLSFRFLLWLIVIGGSLRIISVCKQAARRCGRRIDREREKRDQSADQWARRRPRCDHYKGREELIIKTDHWRNCGRRGETRTSIMVLDCG